MQYNIKQQQIKCLSKLVINMISTAFFMFKMIKKIEATVVSSLLKITITNNLLYFKTNDLKLHKIAIFDI